MRAYLAIFLASLLLLGCIGLEGSEEQPQQQVQVEQQTEPQEQTQFITVSFESLPFKVSAGEPVNILWTVSSNEEKQIRTGVVYGKSSVAFPNVPSDYENKIEERQGTSPANFLESITFEEPGTYYLRAYAIVEGKIYWSEERSLEVVGPSEELATNVRVHSLEITSEGKFNETVITEAINSNLRIWFKSNYNKRVIIETPSLGEVAPLVLDPKDMGYIEFKALNTLLVIAKDNEGNKLDEMRIIIAGE